MNMTDLGGVLVTHLEMKPTYHVSYFRTVRTLEVLASLTYTNI